mgnify:FL=1
MVKITKMLLDNKSRLRAGGNYKKTSVTIHSTANEKSTAANERTWLDNISNNRNASWHYAVDEKSIIQALPDGEEAWHCSVKEGNRHSISIEICESGNRKKAVENAAYLTAKLLKKYGLGKEKIKQHYDWNGKNCPRILRDKKYVKDEADWNYFLKRVDFYMEERKVYKSIDEIPQWGKTTIKKLIEKGYIAGSSKVNLNLDEMAVRILVINDRAGIYDLK